MSGVVLLAFALLCKRTNLILIASAAESSQARDHSMVNPQPPESDHQVQQRAERVQRWILLSAAVLILLPLLLAWFSGAIRF